MPANLECFEADGTTPVTFHDWATVNPGQTSAAHTVMIKNTGDAPALNVLLEPGTVGATDLEGWMTVTVGGTPYAAPTPAPLGTIAAGASVTVTVTAAVPDGTAATTDYRNAILTPTWE